MIFIYHLNPPGCGALFLRRATERPCKKQTAFLLRLADFCFAPRRALAKPGALRQTQLPVSSTGRGRCVCPCSASPVSAAGSGSAAQPSTLLSESPCRCAAVLLRLANFPSGRRSALVKIGALRQTQLPVSSAGRGRCVCLLRLAGFCGAPRRALAKIGALLRVAVSQIYGAGRGPLVYLDGCPCSASAVSAAGSASAAQPASPRCFCRRQRSAQLPPFEGNLPQTAPSSFSFAGTFRPALCGCCAACTQEEQSVARAPPGRARRAGGPLTGGGRDSIKTKTEQFVAKESSLQP